jgi:hypothetical protein
MAVLTAQELEVMRRHWERELGDEAHGLTKAQFNAAVQAIEDRFETSRNVLINDVNTATAPATTSTRQKRLFLGVWCALKAYREGVLTS